MFGKRLILSTMALSFSAVMLLTGCEKQIEGNETTHPIYIKAKKDAEAGKYGDAAKAMEDLLAKAPKSTLLHKELAELYTQMTPADYYRAIYHMSCYIEIGGSTLSAEDKRIANNAIEENKRRAAQEYGIESGTTDVTGDMNAVDPDEVAQLKEQIAVVEQKNMFLEARNAGLTKALDDALAAQKAESKPAKTKKSAAASTTAESDATLADSGETFEYLVQPGDTLSRIVKKNYGKDNPAIVKKIVEINKLKNAGAIQLGQTLKLPKISK